MAVDHLLQLEPIDADQIAAGDSQNLSSKQERFVEAIVNGNNQTHAATLAGYTAPMQEGWRLCQLAHIQRAIRARVSAKLNTQGASIGIDTLVKIASDETAPKGARVQAANSLLDRAGFVSKTLEKQRDTDDKPLSEMSASELEGLIGKLTHKLDASAARRGAEDGEYSEPVTIEAEKP